jgi:hypothetical protein
VAAVRGPVSSPAARDTRNLLRAKSLSDCSSRARIGMPFDVGVDHRCDCRDTTLMPAKRLAVLLLLVVATSVGAAQSTPTGPTTLRVRGTIEKYEASTRILTMSTSNGDMRFRLTLATRVRQAGRAIDAAALEQLAGYRADVHYSESAGHTTVESVHVVDKTKG